MVGSGGLLKKYDMVPMPTQIVSPTPTYFSQLGNDGADRLPLDLTIIYHAMIYIKRNLRVSCY